MPPSAAPSSTDQRRRRQAGAAVAEFALVAPLALVVALAVAQFALQLYERNVVMTALSEGARIGATAGRTPADGRAAACELVRQALGDRCAALTVTAARRGDVVVLTADGAFPPLLPGLPGGRVHAVARMRDENALLPPGARP